MRTLIAIMFFGVILSIGCASNLFFVQEIGSDEIIAEKEAIDKLDNPAMQYRKLSELSNKKVFLNDVLVKDIIESQHVDYTFCVIAELTVRDKKVECHIYSASIKTISKLNKQQSIIDVSGTFRRFFSTLDDYYTKIEITNATIRINEPVKEEENEVTNEETNTEIKE